MTGTTLAAVSYVLCPDLSQQTDLCKKKENQKNDSRLYLQTDPAGGDAFGGPVVTHEEKVTSICFVDTISAEKMKM